ncbi:MAG: beta-glucosidase [Bacteroidetes bacterium 24-39-8]|nr:MAG: beta-glucosidase [Bacteroidetes bacterium 24-39-8]HQR94412.1 GH1 family beta-glucosidase [Sediminibacterium sp.]HQS56520.1 GH1 family beta-glucosidase [Sediminibacterium sp.]
MNISVNDFGPNFHWGVSTAAYQIEGAHDKYGKGPSIWDEFVKKKRKILNNHTGEVACDFYHRYSNDLALVKRMHIPSYRFSIAWSRIFPKGIGQVNQAGIDYYHRVIDFCLELGIEPWITLYHWDLPQNLQEKGGWANRDIVQWFGIFVETCMKHFGSKVRHWMVLNEPMVFTGAGYFLGVHAPGKKGLNNFLAAAHHAALCQSEGGRIIKSMHPNIKVGTTFSYSHIEPFVENSEKDIKASLKVDALLNKLFLEPLLGLGYPTKELKLLNRIEKFMLQDDEKSLAFPMDFIGLQNYTREKVSHSYFIPLLQAKIVKANKRGVPSTLMNWEVHPPCIFNALERYGSYPQIKEIIVTENGSAFEDKIEENQVNDIERTSYLQEHIAQVKLAKQAGIPVNGYFVWTLMDNFEWAEGYHPRFGLVHIDFATQKRTIKMSGNWYKQFLSEIADGN